MTPAISLLKQKKIKHQVHQYEHDPTHASFGEEAADALGLNNTQVFKTLLVSMGGAPLKLAVGVVPVSGLLNLKQMAKALGAKKIEMAPPQEAERATGYVVGGISPLGQKKRLPCIIDDSALTLERIFVSAGKRGLEIELSPQDLATLTGATFAPVGRPD